MKTLKKITERGYKKIVKSMYMRIILTVAVYMVLWQTQNYTFIKDHFNLIMPILLTLLDCQDAFFFGGKQIPKLKERSLFSSFEYQLWDKTIDIFSYLMLPVFFSPKDVPFLTIFIVYRLIGVILFSLTRNSKYLIVFFDFVKEYLLYGYIFGPTVRYLPIFVILKIAFEFKNYL